MFGETKMSHASELDAPTRWFQVARLNWTWNKWAWRGKMGKETPRASCLFGKRVTKNRVCSRSRLLGGAYTLKRLPRIKLVAPHGRTELESFDSFG